MVFGDGAAIRSGSVGQESGDKNLQHQASYSFMAEVTSAPAIIMSGKSNVFSGTHLDLAAHDPMAEAQKKQDFQNNQEMQKRLAFAAPMSGNQFSHDDLTYITDRTLRNVG
jgi:hypothetical protein